jgi:hypothetical protein
MIDWLVAGPHVGLVFLYVVKRWCFWRCRLSILMGVCVHFTCGGAIMFGGEAGGSKAALDDIMIWRAPTYISSMGKSIWVDSCPGERR